MTNIGPRTEKVLNFMQKHGIPILELNTIIRGVQASCRMAYVEVNGKPVMTGNFWDFHKDCHGFDLPDFNGSDSLVGLFEHAFKKSNKEFTTIVDKNWVYED